MFIEKDCIFELDGKKFESGGAWIVPCSDGRFRGVVYEKEEYVSTWHGEKIAPAKFGRVYRGKFCKMQSVSFTYEGKRFYGKYCPDWSQAIRVKSAK